MESNSEQTTTFTDSVVFEIIKEFGARAEKGYNKYGTDMDRTDLSVVDWCQHLREELMDGLVYLTRLKKDIMELELEITAHRLNAENKVNEDGTKIVYHISPKPSWMKPKPKPNETYTDEEPIVRTKYNWHR
jgi:hypothetical protein